MASRTLEEEAGHALGCGSRDQLSPEVQAIYDRLLDERRTRGAPSLMPSAETEAAGRRGMDDVDPTRGDMPKSVLRRLRRVARIRCLAPPASAPIPPPLSRFFRIVHLIPT